MMQRCQERVQEYDDARKEYKMPTPVWYTPFHHPVIQLFTLPMSAIVSYGDGTSAGVLSK